jgi:hypothetical protein
MQEQTYHIRISPDNLRNDLKLGKFILGSVPTPISADPCCSIVTISNTPPSNYSGYTFYYPPLPDILSGGTNGSSLLTGLTIPIMLTQNAIDIGYYSLFDGMLFQQDTLTNFIFSGNPSNAYRLFLTNTSAVSAKKFLEFSTYTIDWGDGTPTESVPSNLGNNYFHDYPSFSSNYTITMSGNSPWGLNIIKKEVAIPISGVTIPNPNGTAYFVPQGGSWSGTPLSYDYLFSGDSSCDFALDSYDDFTSVPFLITGYTKSSLNDLRVYGNRNNLYAGSFLLGFPISGSSGVIGTFHGPDVSGLFTSYTINDILYYDYIDGTTIFLVEQSGFTNDTIVCSTITKDEVLLNVISEPEVQSNIFVERGKLSGLERLIRLGEVDNVGDLEKYGYKFFNIVNI